MPRKRFSRDQIVVRLRQIEVAVSRGKKPSAACSPSIMPLEPRTAMQ